MPGYMLALVGALALTGVAYFFTIPEPSITDTSICCYPPAKWGIDSLISCISEFLLMWIVSVLMTFLNRKYNLEQGTSALGSSFFLIATAAVPAFTLCLSTPMLMALACILALMYLFRYNEHSQTARPFFIMATFFGWGSLIDYSFLILAIGVYLAAASLREINIKSTLAFLLGILAPYIIMFSIGKITFADFYIENPYLSEFNYPWTTLVCATVTALTALMLLMRQAVVSNNQSSRANALNRAVNIILLVMIAAMMIDCFNITHYMPVVNMLTGFVISGLAGDRRANASGMLIFILITLYIITFCFTL